MIDMIDEARTLEIFGYTSDELKPKSNKKVVAVCEECGKYRLLQKVDHTELCLSCSLKGRKLTEEHRRKISESESGKVVSEETRAKLRQSNTGKTASTQSCIRRSASHQGISYDAWEGFARDHPYCPKFNTSCRESNREKYNRQCFICGKPEADNTTKSGNHRKLSVHHVDMQKKQGCDGYNWKLVPLCMGCHTKSHNDPLLSRIQFICDDG